MSEVGGWSYSPNTAITENAWHCVEMHITSPSASTPMQIWVDGASAGTITGAYSSAATFTYMLLGDVQLGHRHHEQNWHVLLGRSDRFQLLYRTAGLDAARPPARCSRRNRRTTSPAPLPSRSCRPTGTPPPTPTSGISGYQYAIGTTPAAPTSSTGPRGQRANSDANRLVADRGPIYYFSVQAVNGAGLIIGSATNSDGQTVLTAHAQPAGQCPRRNRRGIAYTTSTTQLSANWDAGMIPTVRSRPTSTPSAPRPAARRLSPGPPWATSPVTKTGLSLTNGQIYYFSVKAVDNAGPAAPPRNSNGQTVTRPRPRRPPCGMERARISRPPLPPRSCRPIGTPARDAESGISGYQYLPSAPRPAAREIFGWTGWAT